MDCPVDGTTLAIAERSGVEIDYCPKCRGVWLDRGELDKIIDRADSDDDDERREPGRAYRPEPSAPQYPQYPQQYGRPYKRKKKNLLSELFDFD